MLSLEVKTRTNCIYAPQFMFPHDRWQPFKRKPPYAELVIQDNIYLEIRKSILEGRYLLEGQISQTYLYS